VYSLYAVRYVCVGTQVGWEKKGGGEIHVPKVRQPRIGKLLEVLPIGASKHWSRVSWLEKEVELSGNSCCG